MATAFSFEISCAEGLRDELFATTVALSKAWRHRLYMYSARRGDNLSGLPKAAVQIRSVLLTMHDIVVVVVVLTSYFLADFDAGGLFCTLPMVML